MKSSQNNQTTECFCMINYNRLEYEIKRDLLNYCKKTRFSKFCVCTPDKRFDANEYYRYFLRTTKSSSSASRKTEAPSTTERHVTSVRCFASSTFIILSTAWR